PKLQSRVSNSSESAYCLRPPDSGATELTRTRSAARSSISACRRSFESHRPGSSKAGKNPGRSSQSNPCSIWSYAPRVVKLNFMSDQSAPTSGVGVTLGEAFQEYLNSLKTEQRNSQRTYVWKCVEHFGDDLPVRALSGSRVESYAESQISPSDPSAPEQVAALKSWFQFLKKRNFTDQNFGVHIRVRRPHGRAAGEVTRVRAEEALVEMTAEGHEALKRELQELNSQTPDLVKAIALAREDKDFRENAPLDDAREALAFSY